MKMLILIFTFTLLSCSSLKRYPMKTDFPISSGVELSSHSKVLYLSGAIPKVYNSSAKKYSLAYWGDFKTQVKTTLDSIKESLIEKGYTLNDIVKMNVYIVPDKNGKLPFSDFMKVYLDYFQEPAFYPARTVVGTPVLALDNLLIEIEVIAAK